MRVELAGADASLFLSADESDVFEHFEVLDEGGEGHVEGGGEFGDGGGSVCESVDDGEACGVGKA